MKSYKELQAEIKALQVQAEKARQAELANVIMEIKAKIQEYGITGADLFPSEKKPGKAATTVRPKFRNPETGETWTGRGKAPKWIEGKNRAEFLIDSGK